MLFYWACLFFLPTMLVKRAAGFRFESEAPLLVEAGPHEFDWVGSLLFEYDEFTLGCWLSKVVLVM